MLWPRKALEQSVPFIYHSFMFTADDISRAQLIAKKLDESGLAKRAYTSAAKPPGVSFPGRPELPPIQENPYNENRPGMSRVVDPMRPAAPSPAPNPAGNFGNLEGNPNSFNLSWPKYNEPPPAYTPMLRPRTLGESISAMGKGALGVTGDAASAVLTGAKGMPGMLENSIWNAGRGVRDVWQGRKEWGAVPGVARKLLAVPAGMFYGNIQHPEGFSGPARRFWQNSSDNRERLSAPISWGKHVWNNVFGPSDMPNEGR